MIKIFDKLYRKYRDKRAVKEGYKDFEDKVRMEALLDMELPLDLVYAAHSKIEREKDGVKYSYVDTEFFLVQEDINKPGMVVGEAIQLTGDNIGEQVHYCKTDMPEAPIKLFNSSVDFAAKLNGEKHLFARCSTKYGYGEWILSVYYEQKNNPHHFLGEFADKSTMKLSHIVNIAKDYNSRVENNAFEEAFEKRKKRLAERDSRRKMKDTRDNVKSLFESEK